VNRLLRLQDAVESVELHGFRDPRTRARRGLPELFRWTIVAELFDSNSEERETRKLVLVALSLLVSASLAMAQSKIDTKWHCSKPTDQKIDVGDVPDHTFWIGEGPCDATSSTGDLKEKSGHFAEFHDAWKASFSFHGYYNATAEDGDKVYYTYEGSGSSDPTKPISNKWKIVRGSGKLKGIKGSGSCSGKVNDDGSDDLTCTGTYSMGVAKTEKMSK